ncbi:DDE family transposase [Faecalicatena orotica]|uniref:DDE family transposase n=2 Tax=Faecalicatena orotica TaxID=1544 RepID=A0A2Y9BC53_9FIRM|nr:DDE family transposase [Faecalicatena orotica]SSA55077.1 Transposase DDE domain-containing protein [Faecalicatena orotica]
MGLLMDRNGIPLAYDLFPGNESEKVHMRPIINRMKEEFADSHRPSKKTGRVDQKQMAYYSDKYAKKQKADKEAMVARAKDLIKSPKKYDRITSAGSAAYVKNLSFDKATGEIVEGKTLELDEEKIREQELYDGYYSIVTSELDMTDLEMRKIYRGLAQIEDTFKISTSEYRTQLQVRRLLRY